MGRDSMPIKHFSSRNGAEDLDSHSVDPELDAASWSLNRVQRVEAGDSEARIFTKVDKIMSRNHGTMISLVVIRIDLGPFCRAEPVLPLEYRAACRFAGARWRLISVARSLLTFPFAVARRAVKSRFPVIDVVLAAAIAMIVVVPAAHADSMDEVVVAHRGATMSKYAEETLPAYRFAVRNRADMLDADVRWTKDRPGRDSVGTMIILHDRTLDRISNCHGRVSEWRWSSIRAKCRTDVGGQRLMRLIDLLRYGNSLGKSFTLEIKLTSITDAQAKQFWNAVKSSRVQLVARATRIAPLKKIKKLDEADRSHRISYAFSTRGSDRWPSVSAIKNMANAVYAKPTIPVTVARRYRQANIKVFLSPGKNESDYAKMMARKPYAVVVNNVARFERWRDNH